MEKDVPDLEGYINFLSRALPNVKFVFNHRTISDVAKSKWWVGMPNAVSMLTEADARFRRFEDPEKFFHFSYDLALQQRSHVRELIEFVDLGYDETKTNEVFATPQSY